MGEFCVLAGGIWRKFVLICHIMPKLSKNGNIIIFKVLENAFKVLENAFNVLEIAFKVLENGFNVLEYGFKVFENVFKTLESQDV